MSKMKTFITRAYVCLLLLNGVKTDSSETYFDAFNEMTDLHDLCPFSTFCETNVTFDAKETDEYVPCCKSCSCDNDCGIRGNCCFKYINQKLTKETDSMICVSSVMAERVVRNQPHFRMVNKCSTIHNESESFCGQNTTSFGPVVSPDTGLIYYNEQCAECNGAHNTITWKTAFTCLSDSELLPEFIDSFLNKKSSLFNSVCFAYYIPPPRLNLASQACDPYVLRKCNATGIMRKEEPYWKFCEMFNGTYTEAESGNMYGNVYCYLCNVAVNENPTNIVKNKWCPNKGDGFNNGKIQSTSPLTIFLNSVSSQKKVAPKTERVPSQCPENSKLVTSFEMSCRPLKCPYGQMRLNNKCGYYSNNWVGGPFAVMLKLTPAWENDLIPLSFFTDMHTTDIYDRKAKWLKRNTLQEWNFVFLYHQTLETDNVDFIVVKAAYPFSDVNPNRLAKLVKGALKDIWFIQCGNTTIALDVSFKKYNVYSFAKSEGIQDSTHDQGFCPLALLCFRQSIQNLICVQDMIYPILPISEKQLNEGIFVTKMFFCDQMELLPEEFSFGCNTVTLYVRNITLFFFSKVADQLYGDVKVHVCVDEFPLVEKAAATMTAYGSWKFAMKLLVIEICILNSKIIVP